MQEVKVDLAGWRNSCFQINSHKFNLCCRVVRIIEAQWLIKTFSCITCQQYVTITVSKWHLICCHHETQPHSNHTIAQWSCLWLCLVKACTRSLTLIGSDHKLICFFSNLFNQTFTLDSGSVLDLPVLLFFSCSEAALGFGFLTPCKLSYRQNRGRARACSLLDPVSLWVVVEGRPLYGSKEAEAGPCVCLYVCVSLKIEAVCLSHTVGPTSCFHCPSLLPRERREEGDTDNSPGAPLPPSYLVLSSLICRPVWAQCVAYSTIQSHRYVRNARWRRNKLQVILPLLLSAALSINKAFTADPDMR